MLYAALKSGPNTDFFSRDLMRGHAFLLGNELKGIFRRWQHQHQYTLIHATDYGKIVVKVIFIIFITGGGPGFDFNYFFFFVGTSKI